VAGMERCKDCKHWKPSDDPHYLGDDAPHRTCDRIILAGWFGDEHEQPAPLAFTQDGSGYKAVLWTAPDFGCVLFEALRPQPHTPLDQEHDSPDNGEDHRDP